MAESTQKTEKPQSGKSNKIAIIIALLAIVIIIQGVKIYLDHQDIVEKEEKIVSTEEDLAVTLQKLNDMTNELDLKIMELEKLGGDVEELKKAKADLDNEKSQLERTRTANRKQITALNDKVSGYEELLKAKDEEINKLLKVNQELLTENVELKTDKNVLFDSIFRMSKTQSELSSKVAIASRLKAENIRVIGLNEKGKEFDGDLRKRNLKKLKVEFNIAENNVAPVEGKNILIRVIDGNGQVLFDVARGSGTFMYENKEEFFTASQEILFDNSRQLITFIYDKGSDYEPGQYTMEIYDRDYRMGVKQFIVK
jgi:hypothetical protein